MKQLKYLTAIGAVFVLIAGTLAHFLYDWSGNNYVVGLFTPVNESVWEHMKLLFFPMLLYSLILTSLFQKKYPCITSALCFGIIAGTFLIPVFFYAYTALLGKNLFVLDIGTFLLSILIAFLLSCRLALSCRLKPFTPLLCGLVCILFVCFLLFSHHPPEGRIFEDPAAVDSSSIMRFDFSFLFLQQDSDRFILFDIFIDKSFSLCHALFLFLPV